MMMCGSGCLLRPWNRPARCQPESSKPRCPFRKSTTNSNRYQTLIPAPDAGDARAVREERCKETLGAWSGELPPLRGHDGQAVSRSKQMSGNGPVSLMSFRCSRVGRIGAKGFRRPVSLPSVPWTC